MVPVAAQARLAGAGSRPSPPVLGQGVTLWLHLKWQHLMSPFLAGPWCQGQAVHQPRAGVACRTRLRESHCVPLLLAGHRHAPECGTCPCLHLLLLPSLLVQLWFCLLIYSHTSMGCLLRCLNRKLPIICYGMSGCKSHIEDLPGLLTFTLVIMSMKKG